MYDWQTKGFHLNYKSLSDFSLFFLLIDRSMKAAGRWTESRLQMWDENPLTFDGMRCFMFLGTCLCDPPSSIHPNTGSSQKQSWWEQLEKSGTRLQFSPLQPLLCTPIRPIARMGFFREERRVPRVTGAEVTHADGFPLQLDGHLGEGRWESWRAPSGERSKKGVSTKCLWLF